MTKPSVELTVEVRDADGVQTRWSGDHPDAGTRPTGLVFRTQRMEGFADASVTLARRADQDYPDLNLLDDIRFVGEDGTVAYEGRIGGLPRSVDTSHSIGVQAAGWMRQATRRKFTEVFVDRDLTRWTGASTTRKIANATAGRNTLDPAVDNDVGGGLRALTTQIMGKWSIPQFAEAIYDAGPGNTIGSVRYAWRRNANVNTADANWDWQVGLFNADDLTGGQTTGSLVAAGPADSTYVATADTRRYAMVWLEYDPAGTGGDDAKPYAIHWTVLAVYGNHGLPKVGGGTATSAPGVRASDVIRYVFESWCPKINTAGVQDTSFGIEHLVFRDPTTPYDALLYVNAYHLWNAGVWENRTLHWGPIDRTDYDWEIRLSDGATWSLQGDTVDELANGITVAFTNVATGRQEYLTPDDYAELRDPNPNNPATRHGDKDWHDYTLSFPTTLASALQIGRAALAEYNQPKAPGTITCRFHVRDRQGNWQPARRVRSGDRLIISDHPNDSVRVVHETSYDGDNHQLTIAVDSTRHALEAVIDRTNTALAAAGLS